MTIDKNSYGADVCETCNGHGEIGGWVGQTAESSGWDSMPCPDCDRQESDYRVARSKSHRLQAESYRFSAQADRLFAIQMAGLPETAETYAKCAAQSERMAGDYDRMADSLDQEIAATARRASALAALESQS